MNRLHYESRAGFGLCALITFEAYMQTDNKSDFETARNKSEFSLSGIEHDSDVFYYNIFLVTQKS